MLWPKASRDIPPRFADHAMLALSVIGLLAILFLTLFPFDIDWTRGVSLAELRFHTPAPLDTALNLLLMVPLGVGIAGILRNYRYLRTTIPALLGATIALGVETLQTQMPFRYGNLNDVVTNAAGAWVGGLLYPKLGPWFTAICWRLLGAGRVRLSRRKILWITLAVQVPVTLILIPWPHLRSLENWDFTHRLALGNEPTGDSAWRGTIYEVRFNESGGYRFVSGEPESFGKVPELDWVGGRPSFVESGAPVDRKHWLLSTQAPSHFIYEAIKTSRFQIDLKLATADTQQYVFPNRIDVAPARILAISNGPWSANLVIGQRGSDLAIRLRTPGNVGNGQHPEVLVPNLLADKNIRRISLGYDGSTLVIDADHAGRWELTAEVLHLWRVLPGHTYLLPLVASTLRVYRITYFVLLLSPLGVGTAAILYQAIARTMRRRGNLYLHEHSAG